MKKLLQIELIKTLNNSTFKVILILHFLLFLLLVYVSTRIDLSVPGFSTQKMFMFPNVWPLFTWYASWFNLLFLGIIIIILTGNEFSFKTSRLMITNGLSRNEFLLGKGILILLVSAWGLVLIFLAGSVTGFIFTEDFSLIKFFENTYILLVYFVQAIAYMCLALLFSTIFKNNALSIMMYLLYFIMIEPIFRLFLPKLVRPYFPVKVISGLTPVPEFLSLASDKSFISTNGQNQLDFESMGILPEAIPLHTSLILSVLYISLFVIASWYIVKKKDL